MKIYLYLGNKLLNFSLPKTISGSFSFDENPEEESKLINIEARDNQWYIYSTTDSSLIVNGGTQISASLVANNYYTIRRNNIDYLIYVADLFDDSFLTYSYNEQLNLAIGNVQECNVNFSCELLNGVSANILYKDNHFVLEVQHESNVYLNDIRVISPSVFIRVGDQINIYGLRIIFLMNMLLINNPMNKVNINFQTAGIIYKPLLIGDKPEDKEIKEVELYSKEEYFSKSPRLRRIIKIKEIELSPPPRNGGESEMPLLLTIGPMITMGIVSVINVVNTVSKIQSGSTTIGQAWPQLVSSGVMLISMLLWPSLTKIFNKKIKEKRKKELNEKYTAYLNEKRQELLQEVNLQKSILIENFITTDECLNLIKNARLNFWDKRIEQSDFLEVRIGKGNELLDVRVNYPEEGFTIEENELKAQADKMVSDFKYINDVPIGYSLYQDKITAIMGNKIKGYGLVNNIILQLITFYSYEDVKIVVFTNEENKTKWEYIKYLNHSFSNDKSVRFFSSCLDSSKRLGDYLNYELQNRMVLAQNSSGFVKPYYVVIIDDYDLIKRHNFIKSLTEIDTNLGFSMVIIENSMSKLPSKCNNFISLGEKTSGVLRNSYEEQEQIVFFDEINYSIDMMQVVKRLSNIPIEFQEGNTQIPDSITFLEMERVGKVEQLNILNRWNSNDSTTSLRAEIGVDEESNMMYLDLHEKVHGPHGLIAGTTGSGKSEFIITYILSMCINYSPDDVAFILIDYKGGGLALAFENKTTGVSLPHLAGTITNLDKAEMDRTLVSIDSESKRRQALFNQARDKLGESTIDIYKYQRFYKEGKVEEPIPHLFIICDEFAELKSQQPEFMDNLISVARIGRSLGIHLILATQKPSGVVNDQIWSNSKFKVCLKVQTEADSKEMLKKPDAAHIKQTGRFYLQVGYDEYYALGQSGWCGAKYYPSERIVKQVDKSVNFIDDTGNFIKNIQAGNNMKLEADGEQLGAIMKNIIEVADKMNKRTRRLWLNDIEPIILVDNLIRKYHIQRTAYDVRAIIGEYDAPEKQEQGLLEYSYQTNGNTIIYGNDEYEREKVLTAIIYSTCIYHTAKEVNIYVVDYGSETLRMFEKFPQVGGIAYMGEDEELKNVFKLVAAELKNRKKLLVPYGGSLESYNSKNEKKIPYLLFILNNYENILEVQRDIGDEISSIGRDCERYGVNLMITCSMPSTLGRRISQCFENKYALHLTDSSDYYAVFNMKCRVKPRGTIGRGITYNGDIHEFQTASIVDEEHNVHEYIESISEKISSMDSSVAAPIPHLPERVTYDIISKDVSTIDKVPIGISRDSLKIIKYDFSQYASTAISSNKLININSFIDSLIDVLLNIQNVVVFFVDVMQLMPTIANKDLNGKKVNYIDNNFTEVLKKFVEIETDSKNYQYRLIYIIYGLEKLKSKVESTAVIDGFFKEIKKSEHSNLILCESTKGFKSLDFESWYTPVKNGTDGIWIGKGFAEQQNFRVSKITKEMSIKYSNSYGYCLKESSPELMKVIEFNESLNQEDEDEE